MSASNDMGGPGRHRWPHLSTMSRQKTTELGIGAATVFQVQPICRHQSPALRAGIAAGHRLRGGHLRTQQPQRLLPPCTPAGAAVAVAAQAGQPGVVVEPLREVRLVGRDGGGTRRGEGHGRLRRIGLCGRPHGRAVVVGVGRVCTGAGVAREWRLR